MAQSPPPSPAGDPPDLDSVFGWIQSSLDRLKTTLDGDTSEAGASRAFHQLLAVAAVANARLQGVAGTVSPGPPSPLAAGPDPSDAWASLTARFEGLAGDARELIATIAQRIGATGYSVSVSFPWGISFTLDFALPKSTGGSSRHPAGGPSGSSGPGAPPGFM